MSLTQFLSDLKCIFTEADKTWIKRHRLLNTATVFDTLYGACTRNRGLVHIIAENQSKFSDVAIHNARVKIPLETFKKVNTSIIQTQKRVNSSRIMAQRVADDKFWQALQQDNRRRARWRQNCQT